MLVENVYIIEINAAMPIHFHHFGTMLERSKWITVYYIIFYIQGNYLTLVKQLPIAVFAYLKQDRNHKLWKRKQYNVLHTTIYVALRSQKLLMHFGI